MVRGLFRWRRASSPIAPPHHSPEPADDTSSDTYDLNETIGTNIDLLEAQVTESEADLEQARQSLRSAQEMVDDCEDNILHLEVEEYRLLIQQPAEQSAGDPPSRVLGDVQLHIHREYTELMGSLDAVQDAESEVESCENTLDELHSEIDALYSAWQDRALRRADEILQQVAEEPSVPCAGEADDRLLSKGLRLPLSPDAQKLLTSCENLLERFRNDKALQDDDNSPVIASMAKCLERVFHDAFHDRGDEVLNNPEVMRLRNEFKKARIDIPEEDQRYKVEKGSLGRILTVIQKDNQQWSGVRNCGVALLLFGSQLQVHLDDRFVINNPLRLNGTAEEMCSLRLACYEFNEQRNGFVHHDLAGWDDVQRAFKIFRTCLSGIVHAFYTS